MFRELKDFVVAAPVSITIFPAGDELRAVITQKQNGNDHVPLSLAVTGTAEELDRDLPLAIAESRAIPAKSVKEQVIEQSKAQADAADDTSANETASSAKPKARKPAKQKAKAPAPKPKKPARAPTITPLIKPELLTPPAAPKQRAAKDPTPGSRAAEKLAAKREACLNDMREAIAKHGGPVTRAQYAALKTKSGRGYETAFGGWTQFLDAYAAANPAAADAQGAGGTEEHGEKASANATGTDAASTLNPPTVDAAALNTLTQQVPVQTSLLASESAPAVTDGNTVNLF